MNRIVGETSERAVTAGDEQLDLVGGGQPAKLVEDLSRVVAGQHARNIAVGRRLSVVGSQLSVVGYRLWASTIERLLKQRTLIGTAECVCVRTGFISLRWEKTAEIALIQPRSGGMKLARGVSPG